jgi:hypothetical protein
MGIMIKMDVTETGCDDVDWISVADNEYGNEPSGSIKDREFLDWPNDYQFLYMKLV